MKRNKMTDEEAISKLQNFANHAYPNDEFLIAIEAIKQKSKNRYPENVLNHWNGADVLEIIKNELHATTEKHGDGNFYLRDEWIDKIINKYK